MTRMKQQRIELLGAQSLPLRRGAAGELESYGEEGRDGSPISVISHSAEAFSHGSSACQSMEHRQQPIRPHRPRHHHANASLRHHGFSSSSSEDFPPHIHTTNHHQLALVKLDTINSLQEDPCFISRTWPEKAGCIGPRIWGDTLVASSDNTSLTSEAEHYTELEVKPTVIGPNNTVHELLDNFEGEWAKESDRILALSSSKEFCAFHKHQRCEIDVWQADKAFKGPPITRRGGGIKSKGRPYKWDDAEKWLANSQSSSHLVITKHDHPRINAYTVSPSPIVSSFRNTGDVSREVVGTPAACNQCCMASSDSELHKTQAQCEYQWDKSWRFRQHQILQKLKASRDKKTVTNSSSGGRIWPPNAQLESSSCAWKPQILCNVQRQDKSEHTQDGASRMMQQIGSKTPRHGCGASMKDAGTEISPGMSTRDMGTQMSPSRSSCTSKCTSPPAKVVSPLRHNTPTRKNAMQENATRSKPCEKTLSLELQSCHLEKLELRSLPDGGHFHSPSKSTTTVASTWSRRGAEEMDEINSPTTPYSVWPKVDHDSGLIMSLDALEANLAAWEEAERSKCTVKFKREGARIEAWENLQLAKAEADLKKLEVKLEKLRAQATEKIMNKLCVARRRAHEMRAAAEAQQEDHVVRVGDRLHRSSHFPGGFGVCFARVT